jgi:hypothetical protein
MLFLQIERELEINELIERSSEGSTSKSHDKSKAGAQRKRGRKRKLEN